MATQLATLTLAEIQQIAACTDCDSQLSGLWITDGQVNVSVSPLQRREGPRQALSATLTPWGKGSTRGVPTRWG